MRELGHELISLEDARETMLSLIGAIDAEPCATTEAFGRVLRQAVEARDLIPPFDNSAMDGYAVHAADLAPAGEENPVTLPVAFRLRAGEAATEPLGAGSAARIMTGAPLPPGAEAVVPHELTTFTDIEVTFSAPIEAGRNVRLAGGDMKPGDVPLGPGAVLGPSQLGIAATLGYAELEVSRRPRVAILSPGDELVDIGAEPGPGKIRNSNACSLRCSRAAANRSTWGSFPTTSRRSARRFARRSRVAPTPLSRPGAPAPAISTSSRRSSARMQILPTSSRWR